MDVGAGREGLEHRGPDISPFNSGTTNATYGLYDNGIQYTGGKRAERTNSNMTTPARSGSRERTIVDCGEGTECGMSRRSGNQPGRLGGPRRPSMATPGHIMSRIPRW